MRGRLDETTDRWTAERSLTSLTSPRDIAVLTDTRPQVVVAWSEAGSIADDIRSAACGLW